MTEAAEPGFFDRLRARFGLLDHAVRAYQRFDGRNGGFFAAGLTYYTILALFPMLMIGFAAVGFTLSRRPALLHSIDDHIKAAVPGALGEQLLTLMNSAIDARASVGVIGLGTAAWAGLAWMSHLRVALTEMWWEHRADSPGFFRNKLSDLIAMLGTFLVILATIGLTVFNQDAPVAAILRWFGIPEYSAFNYVFRIVSVLVSVLVSWLLFTWMIARLPRLSVDIADSARAALMASVAFELFKQVGSIYLQRVLRSPAGATFGPVLGLMVFAYVTSFLVLFATAWAATTSVDPRAEPVAPPPPAIISPRIQVDDGLSARQTVAAAAAGAASALALTRLLRRSRRRSP